MSKKLNGILGSILFATFGSIPWIILSYFGWITSIAGYIIGLAAYKGYIRGNQKFDLTGKICIIVIIILAIPLAEVVVICVQALKFMPLNYAILLSPRYFIENINDYTSTIFVGYLMAALGTYQFFVPRKKIRMQF